MGSVGKISIDIEGNSAKFSSSAKQVGSDISKIKDQVDHLKRGTAGADVFDKLRESLGKRSALGEATDVIAGGGGRMLGGLTGAADAIKHMAEEAKNLKDQFQSGKLSAGELTEKLISSVPIVGQFWQAGRAIRELFTNEGQDLENANTQAKALDETLKSQKAIFQTLKDSAREYADFMEEIAHRINHANLTNTDAKDELTQRKAADEQADHAAAAQSEQIEREHQEKLKKIREDAQGGIDAARKAQKDYQQSPKGDQTDQEREVHMQTLANITAMAERDRQDAETKINAEYAERQRQAGIANATEKVAEEDRISREFSEKHKEDAERDAKEISDTTAEAQEQALETQGKHLEAQQMQLEHALQEKLQAIKKKAEEESKTFGADDRENQAKVAATAQNKIAAANAKFQSDLDAAQKDDEIAKYEAQQKAAEASNEARKQLMEEGQKLTEESMTPLEKYQEKLQQIRNLYFHDAIDKETAGRAIGQAEKELAATHETHDNAGAAEVRRFDFNVGRVTQATDPKIKVQQDIKQNTDQMAKWLQQLYNFGSTANQQMNQVVDISV
jgi:DNA repair exonuclease SbcCD ATPase subunit